MFPDPTQRDQPFHLAPADVLYLFSGLLKHVVQLFQLVATSLWHVPTVILVSLAI